MPVFNNIEKIPLTILIFTIIWSATLFLAPASLQPGTVVDLDGKANMIDYQSKWNELPIPQRIIYYIGDLHCHQIANRSYFINGNQMPVCSRDVGVFVGCNFGIALVFFVDAKLSPTRAFLNLFIKKKKLEKLEHRRIYVSIILIISALPLVIDGFYQAITAYESTNEIRLITGLIVGIMYSFGTVVFITSEKNK